MVPLVLAAAACSAPAATGKPPAPAVAHAPPSTPGPRAAEPGLVPPAPTLRLPRNFLPASYAATLAIDPALAGFHGTVAITGEVSARSSVIWLHGQQLRIGRAVARRGGAAVPLAVTPHDGDLLELAAQTPLDAGTWTLTIDYAADYELVNTTGAFKQTVGGASYVYTQFEALYARRAVPCFDEPDSKVPWQLTLEVPANLVAVSNTPVVREQALGGGKKRVEFAATKPLPSYLVAFGVGPFEVIDAGKTRSGTPVRIVTMQGRAPEAAWAAETSAHIIDLLEEFFGTPYPYEKMDMLTIPVAVGFGAMENAGLITYDETAMLLDPRHGSKARAYDWVDTAAHELAHQWFGNLVTTAWWDDIWLNEGFATWVEHKITARFDPTWHDELAEVSDRNAALDADSLVTARQIRQPIATPDDIRNAFDDITYGKGASVLNMFESYLGHDAFIRGVRAYLQQHAFGNATSDEFAAAISHSAGRDVGAAFASFLEQPGAPEITATLVCDRGQPARVALSQRRYLPPGSAAPAAGRPWILPVCVAYDRGGQRAEACTMLDAATGSIALDAPACPRWMMPNVRGRGYYRSVYTAAEVEALRDRAWPQLAAAERRAAYFDIAAAATLGKLPLPLALSFVPRLLAGGDRFSVRAALAIPGGVADLVPDDLRPRYQAWLRQTFGAAARTAGLSPKRSDSLDVEGMRSSLIRAVGDLGQDPALTAESIRLADHWRDLPQAIRGQVLTIAAHASPAVFERLKRELYTEPDRTRRDQIVSALGSTPDVERQRAALALVLDPKLDIRDTQSVLFRARGAANRVAAQQFFRDHRDAILQRIPAESTTSGHADLAYVFTASCAAERRAEIVDYVTATFAKLPGGERTVRQAIEGMDQCIARKQLLEPGIRAWLGGAKAAATAAAR